MTACDRCGEHVSPSFYRVWQVDGELDGCPECLPRSVRWGDEDPESVEDFDKDKHNNAKPFGGVKRKGTDDEAVPTR